MRELQTQDMYILSEIADKMNFEFPDYPTVKGKDNDSMSRNYGMKIITYIIKNMHKAKDEINKLMANVTDKSIQEIETMPAAEFVKNLKEILKQPGVLDFFK